MHCPTNKFALKKKAPRLVEGTMGKLTEAEKDAICREIQEGWVNGHIIFGTHSLSFNLLTTRYSRE